MRKFIYETRLEMMGGQFYRSRKVCSFYLRYSLEVFWGECHQEPTQTDISILYSISTVTSIFVLPSVQSQDRSLEVFWGECRQDPTQTDVSILYSISTVTSIFVLPSYGHRTEVWKSLGGSAVRILLRLMSQYYTASLQSPTTYSRPMIASHAGYPTLLQPKTARH